MVKHLIFADDSCVTCHEVEKWKVSGDKPSKYEYSITQDELDCALK